MDRLLNWVGNILFFLVLITVAENLLPGKKYNKYLRLCAGMVLILLVAEPLTAGFHMEEQIKRYFESFSFQQDAKELSNEILGIEKQRLDQVIDGYEHVVEADINTMAREMGLVPVKTRAVIDRDGESGNYGLVVRVEMEVEKPAAAKDDGDNDKIDAVQAVNPVELVAVAVKTGQEDGKPETGEDEENLPQERMVEQLKRKVEGYYGLEAGKVEIKVQGK